MSRIRSSALATLLAVGMTVSARAQQGTVLTVSGDTVKMFTMAQLAALPQVDVQAKEMDGSEFSFRGPTVRSLLTLVGAPTGQGLRGPAMMLAVVAEARDNYKVGFMLSEIDEQFGARMAIVALTQDGKPLSERDGPIRIVIPAEDHKARWVRGLARLRLLRLGS